MMILLDRTVQLGFSDFNSKESKNPENKLSYHILPHSSTFKSLSPQDVFQ